MNIDKVKIQEAINSFLDEKVAQLKPLHKALICIGAILLPCIAFYYLSYSPKSVEINKLQSQQKKLEDEITKVEKASREIIKHRAEMAETRLMFAKASALLPQQQEIPSLLTSISDLGQNSGLDFLSFIPKSEIRQEFYADIPVDIKVRGTYHNVGVFLDKISDLSRIVTVSNINMGGPKPQAGEMILETTFSLVTYRFVEPAPQADNKQKNKKK
ncbi:MAG: pilus assembly protein PilP [Desulfurivibrio sp.]|jgi:type IV pilus assembly protein PilO|nr:MAG: pilus assembly protein PilP [Desulfurivibrio sp.]